ncbi:MAG: hypothetical protein Udaeo2_32060 [Candidatus Udaeobacter sp.]|nr:MAG: hypothetical protein Udaeo2_32060 [Candidatus Udaeobacter sp.]
MAKRAVFGVSKPRKKSQRKTREAEQTQRPRDGGDPAWNGWLKQQEFAHLTSHLRFYAALTIAANETSGAAERPSRETEIVHLTFCLVACCADSAAKRRLSCR